MNGHDPLAAFSFLLANPERTRRVLVRLAEHPYASDPELRAAFDALLDLLHYLAFEEVDVDSDTPEDEP